MSFAAFYNARYACMDRVHFCVVRSSTVMMTLRHYTLFCYRNWSRIISQQLSFHFRLDTSSWTLVSIQLPLKIAFIPRYLLPSSSSISFFYRSRSHPLCFFYFVHFLSLSLSLLGTCPIIWYEIMLCYAILWYTILYWHCTTTHTYIYTYIDSHTICHRDLRPGDAPVVQLLIPLRRCNVPAASLCKRRYTNKRLEIIHLSWCNPQYHVIYCKNNNKLNNNKRWKYNII